jgi:hypothetical protein
MLHAASWLTNLDGIIHVPVNPGASKRSPIPVIPLRYSAVSFFFVGISQR